MTVAELLQFLENVPQDAEVKIFNTDKFEPLLFDDSVWYRPQENVVLFW